MAIQEFSQSLPMLLYQALDAVMPGFRRIFNQFGVTEQQWRVLRVLLDENALPLRELSALTLIPAPSLVGVVDRLTRAGLVSRRPSTTDRRVQFVVATDQGRKLQQALLPLVGAEYSKLMQSIEPREWIQLIKGLQSLSAIGRDVTKSRT